MIAQASQSAPPVRNRWDHILPRSYLAGFTNPFSTGSKKRSKKQGQLAVFDLRRRWWFEASPRDVGAEDGFYDYSPGSMPDQTADEAFFALETKFPNVRRELVRSSFAAWTTHREFLLEYAQMLRARSRLFRVQATSFARQSIVGVVEKVVEEADPTEPTTIRVGLQVKSYVPEEEAQHEQRLRNLAITQMRMEIAKGSGLFSKLCWRLRVTKDPSHPVITADQPVIVIGSAPETPVLQEDGLLDPNSWVVFPVCREACLIGNIANSFKLEPETEYFQPSGLAWLQQWYFKEDSRFVYSPSRVAFHASVDCK